MSLLLIIPVQAAEKPTAVSLDKTADAATDKPPAEAAETKKGKQSKGPKPVGVVNSSNGGVYPPGKIGIITKYMYYKQDQLYSGSDEVDFKPPKKGQKGKKSYERTAQQLQFTFRYGFFDNFDARLIIPIHHREMKRRSANAEFTNDNSGLGDISLIARYAILAQRKKDPLNLAVGVGLKMPTGTTDEEDDYGKCMPGFLQTGSGSWDPIVELGAHKIMGRHWLSSHFMYRYSTQGELGDRDFTRPDMFKYNAAYAYAISKYFDLELEINGLYKTKSELDGETVENSGGNTLYLTPGFHFKFYPGMHFDVCVPITVYRDLNGTQLSEDYRILAKLAITF